MIRGPRAAAAIGALVVGLIPGLTACGGSSSPSTTSTPSAATTTAPPVSKIHVTLTAPTHTPIVNKPWHYVVRVTDASGAPLPALIHLQALFQGQVVGQIGLHRVANGVWAETIEWPAASVGQPLVLQAKVTAKGVTATVNYPLQVAKA
jgi:hypothetical protein